MNILLLHLKQINNDYIFVGETIKNSIIENGMFTRLIYSDKLMSLNGLYLVFEDKINHKESLNALIELEKIILFKANVNKVCQYKIKDYLRYLNARLGSEFQLNRYILKISGIWENTNEYGITFKFLDIKNNCPIHL